MKDSVICLTFLFSSVHLLGGRFIKKPFPYILSAAVIILNAIYGVFIFNAAAEDQGLITDSVSSAIYILTVILCIKDVKLSKRIWFLLICAFTMEMFYSLFAPYLPNHLYVESIVYIIMYSVLLTGIIFARKNSQINFIPQIFDTVPKWMIVAILFFDLTAYYKSFGISSDWYNILYIISTIGVIICVLYFIIRIFSLTYQQNEILRQFQEQKIYSEKMLKGDESLRKFRHDYRNHMIVINALLESGSTDRARNYINAMNSGIRDSISKIATGNFISDAIINNKAVVAAQAGNSISFSGQFPCEGISDEDICTILANALDNALEATDSLGPGKTIYIEGKIKNSNFILNISNPVKENVRIGKNNTLKTSKKNSSEHGIGIKNIQRVVKKYNGSLTLGCENLIFDLGVILTLKK